MRLADHSPRLFVAFAITLAHALVIYGALTLAPHVESIAANRTVEVHFISELESSASWRPPEVAVIPAAVVTSEPDLPAIDIPPGAASAHAISAPQRNAQPTPSEDRSIPRLVSAVEYLREPSPRYPPQSRRLREQGVVVLRVVIDERGQACDIAIETSSGHARLDRAAREAVASAAFRPYVEDGAPRRALVLIPIEFFLNRGSA